MPKDPSKFEGNEGFVSGGNVDELADAMGVGRYRTRGGYRAVQRFCRRRALTGTSRSLPSRLWPSTAIRCMPRRSCCSWAAASAAWPVDDCCRVLAEDGSTIPGLYSAGDTCNRSFHGGFYLGSGSNTCFAMNSGRIAAREAIADLL